MNGLLSTGKNVRRKPARAVSPRQLIAKHPISAAVLYIFIGGTGVYVLWSHHNISPAQQSSSADIQGRHPSSARRADTAQHTAASQANTSDSSAALLAAQRDLVVCTDACSKAKDGVCDDGRPKLAQSSKLSAAVLCDLGTDCTDCGPWRGVQYSSSWTEPEGPVEYLKRHKISLHIQQTPWEPKFWFANTLTSQQSAPSGAAISRSISDTSQITYPLDSVESHMTHITYNVLLEACQRDKDGVMVDVGAGAGWYSILAGMLGCRVVAFEPIAASRAFMEYNIARNILQDKIQVRPSIAVQYPSTTGNRNYTAVEATTSGQVTKVHGADDSLDQLIQHKLQLKHVALLRANAGDAQGPALAGAKELLDKQMVDNILLRYTSAKEYRDDSCDREPKLLLSLLAMGYKIGHIANRVQAGHEETVTLSEPLQTLPAVTESNLKFDLFDCKQMTRSKTDWLSQACQEMRDMQLMGDTLPVRLHPKSFRSSFEGTGYVWASRDARFQAYLQGPSVGVFPSERKITDSWFVPEWSDIAMGGRSCRKLHKQAEQQNMTAADRAALLVRHRCRCGRVESCEKEEAVADKCAKEGRTPFSDNLDRQRSSR